MKRHNVEGRPPLDLKGTRLLSVAVAQEQDVVTARQRARQVASGCGFDHQDEIRIATAVSEIARNAYQYAGGGRVDFAVETSGARPSLLILVNDQGPGISDLNSILEQLYRSRTGMGLGIVGARRLMDDFDIDTGPGRGTRVLMRKTLPRVGGLRNAAGVAALAAKLASAKPTGAFDELQHQNQELLQALDELKRRETELRRLNQELEDTNRGVMALYAELDDKAESLRRADQIKSRFLSHMSHEFRTPLNSIMALGRLLASRMDGDLSPEQDKQIGYIRKAAEELSEMVNDLLDLAKVESGKTTITSAEFPVSNVFGALRGMMRPLQTNEAVTLTIEDPNPALVLNTDEGKVSQVLRNLISNALKFTEQGEVRVSVAAGAEGVVFTVSDTGIGIPADQQEIIFQEFAQVDHPIQRRVKGTGLGLPLSRKLATLLGGDLTVESEVGKGSAFRFQLPVEVISGGLDLRRSETPAATAKAAESAAAQGFSDTLLVIDDDEVSRYLVRQMLRRSSLVVTEAENGIVGLERARFDRPRAILLDLNMPGMSGFEVLEQLRLQPETRDIPVVIYTSRSLSPSERQRLGSISAAIVPKRELNEERFLATLRRLMPLE